MNLLVKSVCRVYALGFRVVLTLYQSAVHGIFLPGYIRGIKVVGAYFLRTTKNHMERRGNYVELVIFVMFVVIVH